MGYNINKHIKYYLFHFITVIATLIICPSCNKRNENAEYDLAILNCQKQNTRNSTNSKCLNNIPMHSFELTDLNNQQISSVKLKGKYYLLNYWFIECEPCVKEIPVLNKIKTKYNNNLEIISICRNTKQEIQEFILTNNINYVVVPDGSTVLDSLFQDPFGYPMSFLIDKDGIILDSYFNFIEGKSNYERLISRLDNIK